MITLEDVKIAISKYLFRNSIERRIAFYTRFASLLASDVELTTVLEKLNFYGSERGANLDTVTAHLTDSLLQSVRSGYPLVQAFDGWIPPDERMFLAATGGQRDSLAPTLNACIKNTQAAGKVTGAFTSALVQPAITTAGSLGLVYYMATALIPEFEDLLPRDKWPPEAAFLSFLGDFVQSGLFYTLAFLVVYVAVVSLTLPRRWDALYLTKLRIVLEAVPPWSIYKTMSGVRFLKAYATLQGAGRPPSEALQILERDSTSYMQERLTPALSYIRDGRSLGDAFDLAGHHFPSAHIIEDLSILNEARDFITALTILADRIEDAAVVSATKLGKLLNILSMIAVTVLIGNLFFAMNALVSNVANPT